MNKTIISVVIAVIVLAGGWWLMKDDAMLAPEQNNITNNKNNDQALTKSSVAELLKSGENLTCDYQVTAEGQEQKGKVYIAGTKMRGEFTMTDKEQTFAGYMIQDSEWVYTWGGPQGEKMGTKMKITAVTPTDSPDQPTDNKTSFDTEAEYEYDCDSWSPDQEMFIPPTDVNFFDLSQTSQQLQESTKQVGNSQCALCEQTPAGEARQQCLQAFGCQ